MEIVARSRFVRTAPDKIRLLSAVIKDKGVEDAISSLNNTSKYASHPLILVLKQAKDQIKEKDGAIDKFKIKQVQIDEGPKLKRRRIRHQGRATAILKRMSHITIILTDNEISNIKNLPDSKAGQKSKVKSDKQELKIDNSKLKIKATEGSA
jgi:large subunit ribosomal protein L22